MILQRPILRDQIKEYLQRQILDGKIRHEDKLSLVDISKQLSVSVTPIREALGQLQQAGIVEVIPNRGFFIPKLELDIAKEIYPIISQLEAMALRTSANLTELANRLDVVEKRMFDAHPAIKVKHDNDFHDVLVSSCPNTTLKKMISDLKLRVIFYETAYMNAPEFEGKSKIAHDQIIKAVKQNDAEKAAQLLELHWRDSLAFVKVYFENSGLA